MKNLFKSIQEKQGSALLVAILLMTFVIVFGLGISSLIVDSIRVEHNVVEAGKSYFAAEGAIEEALYYQENRLPGYNITDETLILDNGAEVTYSMVGTDSQVPCEHQCEDPDDCWLSLELQESVSLPLFKDDGAGARADLEFFNMDYYVDRTGVDTLVNGSVLRWKILGFDDPGLQTEAISDVWDYYDPGTGYVSLSSETVNASFYDLTGPPYTYHDSYSVKTFLEDHFLNYLVLTNVVDLGSQPVGAQEEEYNVIKLKVVAEDETLAHTAGEEAVCEYTYIAADGSSGDTKQSIDVQVKLDSFLPVFDFVLYQTDTS